MILGIGCDIVEIARLKEKISVRFIDRLLSTDEKKVYDTLALPKRKAEFLAGRFAGKEAIFKAFKQGDGKTNYKDISILNHENGFPYVMMENRISSSIHISISHTDCYAMAYVVLEDS